MKARHEHLGEARTARFNIPVQNGSKLRRMLSSLIAPPTRIHRYRNLSAEILEDALEKLDGKPCR
jgi:CubicO group peptidase (beta-lactamase class C family)